jgi:hypothetical protein
MILDITQFGYGVGLVMLGYVAGSTVNYLIRALRAL